MYRQPVYSSNIRSVGYDDTSQVLEIEFHNGSVYRYPMIPAHVHRGLMQAESKGSYFNRIIKSNYAFTRVSQ